MKRNQFTFYESFASALKRIKKKADRADAYDAICNYALYGIEPDMDKLPDSAAIAFDLIKPTLDASKRKAEAGKTGGESKQTSSKTEANRKQSESKSEANASKPEAMGNRNRGETGTEKEGEKENEKEKENECYSSLSVSLTKAPTLQEVQEHAKVNRYVSDPKAFFDYYSAANWRDGNGIPLNWRQKFVSWELREQDKIRKDPRRTGALGASSAAADDAQPGDNVNRLRAYLQQSRAEKSKSEEA